MYTTRNVWPGFIAGHSDSDDKHRLGPHKDCAALDWLLTTHES